MLRVVNLLQNNTNSPQIDEFKLQNVISWKMYAAVC